MIRAVAVVGLSACGPAIPTPASDMATGQAVLDLGMQIVQLREENAMLQAQIDSLRGVMAYQDTVVRQLAAAAGLPTRPPAPPFP
ncbi:MAG: hypothetical protein ACK6DP_05455 [Gemmatimonas sp.]|uniref:hypothetical protein n=1 Tax=Gemmatimonas sp. TaxID=1962908 RepID=UPI00391FB432|nr:hypothetical protein [Gemmatimonadota bacterium]